MNPAALLVFLDRIVFPVSATLMFLGAPGLAFATIYVRVLTFYFHDWQAETPMQAFAVLCWIFGSALLFAIATVVAVLTLLQRVTG